MTAVAPPPFQSLPKSSWGSANGTPNGFHSVSNDDGPRMLMSARKPATRSNSSSSLSSVSSNTSTASANSVNGAASTQSTNGDSRKRPVRGYVWPGMSKSEPMTGLSTGRAQPVGAVSFHPSAVSTISALQMPNSTLSNGQATQPFQDRPNGARSFPEGTPLLCLTPMNGTFERKNLQVPFFPEVIRIGRQTNAKSAPTTVNGFFDSKVLSRQHAEIWSDNKGKIWIRDIKSSNGTFVNGQRLSGENKDSDPHELREQDMLELGIDIVSEDQKTVVHHKVAARVEHAGFATGQNLMEVFNLASELDPSNPNHPMANQLGHMRRNSGPAPNGLRGPNGAPLGSATTYQRAQQPFLLGPVSIEQVIKKLGAEYKLAKQQQNELQRSAQFLDSLLTNPQSKDSQISLDGKGKSSIRDLGSKPRFSDPPNPPPQAPLPEKPFDIPTAGFRRADTEKPKVASPPNGSMRLESSMASQLASLSEALRLAKKEADEQRKKVTDLEELLVEERVKRENAEARAKQLEIERHSIKLANGSIDKHGKEEEQSTTPIEEEANSSIGHKREVVDETTTSKLHKRLEQLLSEVQEAKAVAEKSQSEKEEAQKERDNERKAKSVLLELVEKYQKEERDRSERKDKRGRKDGKPSANSEDVEEVEDVAIISPRSPRSMSLVTNGNLTSSLIRSKDGGTSHPTHLVQATPFLSAVSVVLLGIAILTLVNKVSRNEQ